MFTRLFAALSALVLGSQAMVPLGTIADCGAGTSLFTITKLSQDPPDTVVAGQNISLTLLYNAPEPVTAGTVTKSVTLNFIPFTPTTEDLCTNTQCPITVGDHDGSNWFLFPDGVSGTLVSTVKWQDAAGRQLLCIKSTFKASAAKPADKNESGSWWKVW